MVSPAFTFVAFASLVFAQSLAFAQAPEPHPTKVPLAQEHPKYLDVTLSVDDRVADLVSRMSLEEKGVALNHNGPNLDRFGLRSDKWNQCLHGVVWNEPSTMFPTSIAMAATWDTPLIHDVAVAISDEARAINNGWRDDPNFRGDHKGLIYRAPVINISRNPYWGRIAECYGEDPHLTGRMAVAFVTGLQGDDPKYLKLAATLKHYAVNNVEANRQALDATVPERVLREYWLPHFREAVVEGKVQSLMASYNSLNGTPNNINHWLLTDVLKNEWKHEGFVVSDLGGVNTMVRGHFGQQITFAEAVARSIEAGCDFSDKEFMDNIPTAVREGKLTEERLNDAVRRVMRVRMRLGEFDAPETQAYCKIPTSVIGSAEHRQLALKTACEAIVLLQNKDGLLPLDKSKLKSIAVIGPHADVFTAGGYSGRARDPVTPLAGMRDRAGAGINIVTAVGGEITPPRRGGRGRRGNDAPPPQPMNYEEEIKKAVDAARQAEVAILFIGTNTNVEAEGRDRTSLALPGNQQQLAEAVLAANPKTVVVLMSAGPLVTPWLKANAPAIVQAFWLGEEGGNAIADVIFGNTNPGGRLPYTAYASEEQVPPQDEYDISKGFTYMYVRGEPQYAFGHGLSYTKFEYSNAKAAQPQIGPDGTVKLAVDVKNAGSRTGDEVVQLYTHAATSRMSRPAKELHAFTRITLQPGETKTVALSVPAEKLAYWDVEQHKFVVEPGDYELMVGASAADIRAKTTVKIGSAAP